MHFELWDTTSANLLYDFDTEAEALEAVVALLRGNGPSATEHLALIEAGVRHRSRTVACASELAERAVAATASGEPRSA
jgi:hypothetical protein